MATVMTPVHIYLQHEFYHETTEPIVTIPIDCDSICKCYPRLVNRSQVELSGCGAPSSREEDNSRGTKKAKFGASSQHYNFHAFGGGKHRLAAGKKKQ